MFGPKQSLKYIFLQVGEVLEGGAGMGQVPWSFQSVGQSFELLRSIFILRAIERQGTVGQECSLVLPTHILLYR